MASLGMVFGAAATGRVFAATAAKGGSKEEQSLVDWVLGKVTKQDQFYETDPILRRADDEEKGSSNGTATTGGRKGTVSSKGTVSTKGTVPVQPKKKDGNGGGFGGFFAKK
ncbi:uncharacterized protein LOC141615540 [Silene latifolia]|uniref:uncharacterized protein LOC141615540 n=1 Tax=Silene latifolia TaxID=37657 RepID=UPI003D7717DA